MIHAELIACRVRLPRVLEEVAAVRVYPGRALRPHRRRVEAAEPHARMVIRARRVILGVITDVDSALLVWQALVKRDAGRPSAARNDDPQAVRAVLRARGHVATQ